MNGLSCIKVPQPPHPGAPAERRTYRRRRVRTAHVAPAAVDMISIAAARSARRSVAGAVR